MKVPQYSRQTSEQSTQINTPRVPNAIPGAFGADVAEATTKLGMTVEKAGLSLLEHVEKQRVLNEKALKDTFTNDFKQSIQERLYDTTEENYTDPKTGETRTRTKGIMNQLGDDALDTYEKSKVIFDEEVKSRTSKMRASESVKSEWVSEVAPYRTSITEAALKHQAAQYKIGLGKTFTASLVNLANEAETAQDPEKLSLLLDNVSAKVGDYSNSQGDSSDVRQKTMDLWIAKSAEKAVIGKLMATGSTDDAQKLLEGIKSKIPQETYDNISLKVDKVGEQVRTIQNRKATVEKINNQFTAFTQLANGELNLLNSDDVIRSFAIDSPEFATALKVAVNTKGEFEPETELGVAYADVVKNVFKAGSQEEIAGFLTEALTAYGRKEISQEKLAILASAAYIRGQKIRTVKSDPRPTMDPKQLAIDAGIKAIFSSFSPLAIPDALTYYLKGIISGKPAEQAHAEAAKAVANKNNPLSVAHQIGDKIPLPNGKIFEVTGFTSTGSPTGKIISGKPVSNTK